MLVFLFILLLLAIAGLLGVVFKAVALLILFAVLTTAVLVALAWWALRRQMAKLDRELSRRQTDIQVGSPQRDELPPKRDDRY
jgi:threonine/homoserine/homoserine lactone efflux protein